MKYIKIILLLVIFLTLQALFGLLATLLDYFCSLNSVSLLAWMLVLCNLCIAIVAWSMGLVRGRMTFACNGLPWSKAPWIVMGAVMALVAGNVLSELVDLQDVIELQMLQLCRLPIGILLVAIVGPMVEELMFREAILGELLRMGKTPWTAICISALLFGIIHLNPAQVPFAAAMGVLLGYLYWKTGNVVLPVLVHIVNNSLAVVQCNVMGDKVIEFSLVEWLGGTGQALTVSAICLLLFFIIYRKLSL